MRVYLDHNATTRMRAEVRACLIEQLERGTANPSSAHASGRAARQHVDQARERVAAALGVDEDEIYFTSGATEANNLALLGYLRPRGLDAGLVTTAVEHSSVLEAAGRLAFEGHAVAVTGVDGEGRVTLDELCSAAAEPGYALVSVMAANNEVGSITPLERVGSALAELPRERRPALHTDATQALGRVPLDLRVGRVDLASFSAHKIGGPPGIGVFFRRRGVGTEATAFGGSQEGGVRPGTENVPGIVAAALAFELAVRDREDYARRTRELALLLWTEVQRALPGVSLSGPPMASHERLPNTLNIQVPGVEGRVLVTRLDVEGLEASAGSACASGSLEPSHVLLAMGRSADEARAGLRLSLGHDSTEEDVHNAVEILRKTLGEGRKS